MLTLEAAHSARHSEGICRRVLLVAYSFPPVGGAGVQRPVKWVKYLQRCGWGVTVLTPENPSVPVTDPSLLAEIPPAVRLVRPKTWEPNYQTKQRVGACKPRERDLLQRLKNSAKGMLRNVVKACLQPDPQILWYPNAVAAASAELRRQPHDAILCTAPPYSSFLIGRTLKHRFRLPLILDYRDEWDLSNRYLEHAHRDPVSIYIQERQQRAVLKAADAVIATTQSSIDRLRERLLECNSRARMSRIYNGYDAEDFSTAAAPQEPENARPFRLIYTGTLWNLTDVTPLVNAIEQLDHMRPDLTRQLEFVCVGRKTSDQLQVLKRLDATHAALSNLDYCDHNAALTWLQRADALCVLLSDVPGAERVVPAKVFEYLAARREILAIAPAGEAAGIVSRFQPDNTRLPEDVAGICQWLMTRIENRLNQCRELPWQPEIAEFSREHQSLLLADLMNEVMQAALCES